MLHKYLGKALVTQNSLFDTSEEPVLHIVIAVPIDFGVAILHIASSNDVSSLKYDLLGDLLSRAGWGQSSQREL